MPALKPTDYFAQITWLGSVLSPDRDALIAEPLTSIDLTFDGIKGSVHEGATRLSCARVVSQHRKGTEIRNERQLSLVSEEDLAEIAARMGEARIDPARLGASVVVKGIADFSHLPPSSRLQADSGATLVIDMQNRPCLYPARSIDIVAPGKGKLFKSAAQTRRGVTAWVQRPGRIALGDRLRLHIPDQRAWAP